MLDVGAAEALRSELVAEPVLLLVPYAHARPRHRHHRRDPVVRCRSEVSHPAALATADQRDRAWRPLLDERTPRDLAGQHAVVVGWGGIGQRIGALLAALGLKISVARHSGAPVPQARHTVGYGELPSLLPAADWLVLACPLTSATRNLIGRDALAALPAHAMVVNVARGHVINEPELIAALRAGRLGGAFLDVFQHEPLPPDSALWDLPNVIVTPHSAGFSDGNAARVRALFVDNLNRWLAGEPLANRSIA